MSRLLIGAFIEWIRGIERHVNRRIGWWMSPRRYK